MNSEIRICVRKTYICLSNWGCINPFVYVLYVSYKLVQVWPNCILYILKKNTLNDPSLSKYKKMRSIFLWTLSLSSKLYSKTVQSKAQQDINDSPFKSYPKLLSNSLINCVYNACLFNSVLMYDQGVIKFCICLVLSKSDKQIARLFLCEAFMITFVVEQHSFCMH